MCSVHTHTDSHYICSTIYNAVRVMIFHFVLPSHIIPNAEAYTAVCVRGAKKKLFRIEICEIFLRRDERVCACGYGAIPHCRQCFARFFFLWMTSKFTWKRLLLLCLFPFAMAAHLLSSPAVIHQRMRQETNACTTPVCLVIVFHTNPCQFKTQSVYVRPNSQTTTTKRKAEKGKNIKNCVADREEREKRRV